MNHAQAHKQVDLRIPLTKGFFFFQTSKDHLVFVDQPEDYIGEDDIIDMTEVTVLQLTSLKYVMLYSKTFII